MMYYLSRFFLLFGVTSGREAMIFVFKAVLLFPLFGIGCLVVIPLLLFSLHDYFLYIRAFFEDEHIADLLMHYWLGFLLFYLVIQWIFTVNVNANSRIVEASGVSRHEP
ncbi:MULTISPECIES: hypothetical protein [Dickeya]|uniref:Uncharacterized protein n=1 Tax=Dickeya poaceiphila TaxID=568768 RepID=A0A5B8IBH8_9GAMM|nr:MULTISPECIES: hypothetical protein [Dickeya]QDX30968.1 hypothetical protein Dpoa569_0002921 [Dickeya poaceiphila]